MPNGKVQIRDKQTGTIYPSKNNAYQTLLKSGELKDLVDKGIFGDIPEKNTFGWYALVLDNCRWSPPVHGRGLKLVVLFVTYTSLRFPTLFMPTLHFSLHFYTLP